MVELYPHQKEAVTWMRTTERRPRIVPTQPHGGILAHAMGLGKTMTMLSFIWGQTPGRTLVVCPKSLLLQWEREARTVGYVAPHTVTKYHGSSRQIPEHTTSGHQLILTTFDIVRMERRRGRALHDITWDRVVLDEAHRICEQSSKTAHAIQALRAPNRWCVTGTPFKNGINDLVALSRFLMVDPFCNMMWWKWYGNSATKLREWRRLLLHLRDKSVLYLPPMQSHNLNIILSPAETTLDTCLKEATWKMRVNEEVVEGGGAIPSSFLTHDQHELLRILRMRQAANHPLLLAPHNSMKHQVLGCPTPEGMCEACGGAPAHPPVPASTCTHNLCDTCREEPVCAACITSMLQQEGEWLHSGKTRALWIYLRDVARITTTQTKVVLFSQWTTCLDLLGYMLDHEGVAHACYDGRVNTTEERELVIAHFRDTPSCNVLLTSLGAGGEGVNLTFASHVIIMEPYWNLAAEQQAIDRIHRIGQNKVTHVVRLQLDDSVETWVKNIQTRKTNELQRLLYENVDSNSNSVSGTKRTFTQRLRSQFESGEEVVQEDECLSAFLMHTPSSKQKQKQIKV